MQVALTQSQRRDWLRLIRTDSIGPITFRKLANRFGSVSEALAALPDLTARQGRKLDIPTREQAEAELDALDQMGGQIIAMGEPHYPGLLRHIAGAPPLISVIGSPDALRRDMLAIVGTRNASAAGIAFTKRLAADLGAANYAVASGLARGIDTAAHAASVDTGTVAVFAGGVNVIYPPENTELAETIVGSGGAVISEMPLGWTPRAADFPRRNRLVSGLALGTIVVEAAQRSGSLITARLAAEQGREVFAVPASPMDPRAAGVNSLIRDGATLIRGAEDVIEAVRAMSDHPRTLFAEPEEEPAFEPLEPDTPDYQSAEEKLLGALSVTPVSVDDLAAATGLSPGTLQTLLLDLDISGRIERSAGQLVALGG